MVKFAWNFCYCAVDQEKAILKRKRAVSGPSALLGPEMARKGQNLSRSSARKQPESVWEQPEISQNLFGNSQKRARTCLGESTKCLELVWERPENALQMAWTKAEMTRIGLARKGKTGERRAVRPPPQTKKRPFFNANGPFLAHLPFWASKWSNLQRISAIVL